MVQLKIKTVTGTEFFIEVELTDTIKAAAAKVMESQKYEEGTTLKLICDGKVLADLDKTLSQCGITEKSFLVAF